MKINHFSQDSKWRSIKCVIKKPLKIFSIIGMDDNDPQFFWIFDGGKHGNSFSPGETTARDLHHSELQAYSASKKIKDHYLRKVWYLFPV